MVAGLSTGAAVLVAKIDAAPAGLALAFGGLAAWSAWCGMRGTRAASPPILRLGGFSWDLFSFCRGWLIVGETGSGKTLASINSMLWQVSKNCPTWGGICIDDKGLYWETLSEMFRHLGREKDLILLKVRPDDAPADWKPEHTFNFLEDSRLPYSAKAKDICDVAACAGFPVTLDSAYELLSSDEMLLDVIGLLEDQDTPEAKALVSHFETHIATQPAEQLGGVRGTLANRLKHFTSPDIAAVFCTEKSTFSFADIDRGKVICISIPQRFKVERRYIHTLN